MFTDIFREVFFPRRCLGCGTRGIPGVVCESCLIKTPVHATPCCGRCRARLPQAKKICHPDFPYILAAASEYSDALVRILILNLKFKHNREAAEPLAELMIRH